MGPIMPKLIYLACHCSRLITHSCTWSLLRTWEEELRCKTVSSTLPLTRESSVLAVDMRVLAHAHHSNEVLVFLSRQGLCKHVRSLFSTWYVVEYDGSGCYLFLCTENILQRWVLVSRTRVLYTVILCSPNLLYDNMIIWPYHSWMAIGGDYLSIRLHPCESKGVYRFLTIILSNALVQLLFCMLRGDLEIVTLLQCWERRLYWCCSTSSSLL